MSQVSQCGTSRSGRLIPTIVCYSLLSVERVFEDRRSALSTGRRRLMLDTSRYEFSGRFTLQLAYCRRALMS